jgi:uncharacterized protein involved in type VI secretion and phage assembly
VTTPVTDQASADALAKAIAEEIGGGHAAFEGIARGNPILKAGKAVSLAMVGQPFDGKYTLTSVKHTLDSDTGYTTWFIASGGGDRTTTALVNTGEALVSRHDKIHDIVIGLVTNNDDPDKQMRVKVKFPWLSDQEESAWARVSQLWAGSGYGAMIVPDVNAEVLVAFEHGDIRRPYILGSLYNGIDKADTSYDPLRNSQGIVDKHILRTKNGHQLIFDDTQGAELIRVMTKGDQFVFELNQAQKKIIVNSKDGTVEILGSGRVYIHSDDNIELDAAKDIRLTAGKAMTLKASTDMKLDAMSNLNLKGTSKATLEGTGGVKVSGATAELNGQGMTDVKAGGILTVQGSLVKIN